MLASHTDYYGLTAFRNPDELHHTMLYQIDSMGLSVLMKYDSLSRIGLNDALLKSILSIAEQGP